MHGGFRALIKDPAAPHLLLLVKPGNLSAHPPRTLPDDPIPTPKAPPTLVDDRGHLLPPPLLLVLMNLLLLRPHVPWMEGGRKRSAVLSTAGARVGHRHPGDGDSGGANDGDSGGSPLDADGSR